MKKIRERNDLLCVKNERERERNNILYVKNYEQNGKRIVNLQ